MKKICFILVFTVCLGQLAIAQWVTSGNNINNTNTGNVGIGTTSPAEKLSVNGNMGVQMPADGSGFKLKSSYTGNQSIVELKQEANDGVLYVRAANGSNVSRISGYATSPTYFLSNVGLGTISPSSYYHGGNNRFLEIYNPSTTINSQSHLILTTGSTINNSGAGTISWMSKNSTGFQGMAYIGSSLEGDASSNAKGNLVFATSDGTASHVRMVINKDGNIGFGTMTPAEKLSVNGKIRAHEIKVETANWPDFVFAKDYQLPSLQETETHIKEKGHLPGIPSAAEVAKDGVELGEMNKKLLQKIEELTLYLIEKDKQNKLLTDRIEKLEVGMKELKKAADK